MSTRHLLYPEELVFDEKESQEFKPKDRETSAKGGEKVGNGLPTFLGRCSASRVQQTI